MEIIKEACEAVGGTGIEKADPAGIASFKAAIDGLARAVKHTVWEKLGMEPGTVEAAYGGWNAEVEYTNTVREDAGDDRGVAPSWEITSETYTVKDLWKDDAEVSAPLSFRQRLEDELNRHK